MAKRFLQWVGLAESSISFYDQAGRVLLAIFSWGATMSIFVALTDWMSQYAPASWGFAGMIGFLVAVWVLAGYARFGVWKAQKELVEKKCSDPSLINPLENHFNNSRLTLEELSHPITRKIIGKTLNNCQIIGATTVFAHSGSFISCAFNNCNFVKVREGCYLHNIVFIEDTTFTNCEINATTIMVTEQMAETMNHIEQLNWLNP
jgi:hypothetical protein